MKPSSKRMVSIVGSLLCIVGALFSFFNIIEPAYGNVLNLKGQIGSENAFYQTETQTISTVQKVISDYQAQGGNQGSVALAIPPAQDVAGALAQAYGIAQANGLAIQSVTVSAPSVQAQAPSAKNATSTKSMIKPLGNFSLQISAAGTYESFKNFISALETNIRIFDVKGVTISPAAQGAKGSVQDFFTYNIVALTYYQTQ